MVWAEALPESLEQARAFGFSRARIAGAAGGQRSSQRGAAQQQRLLAAPALP
jgi:hypothetical protein